MRREVELTYNTKEQAFHIRWLLHGDNATMQFYIRCPTPNWNYYLAMDIGYHADKPQYEDQKEMECSCRSSGKCYYDGSSLCAEELWDKFKESGDQELIWKELEKFYNDRFVC